MSIGSLCDYFLTLSAEARGGDVPAICILLFGCVVVCAILAYILNRVMDV